jgi:hypothetical protein
MKTTNGKPTQQIAENKKPFNSSIDIDGVIKLLNKRTTTINDVCEFIFEDMQNFQNSREDFYFEQLKQDFRKGLSGCSESELKQKANEYAEKMHEKIQKDSQKFAISYASKSIDDVLDAINSKRFKNKIGPTNLLVLLSSLKELNETQLI